MVHTAKTLPYEVEKRRPGKTTGGRRTGLAVSDRHPVAQLRTPLATASRVYSFTTWQHECHIAKFNSLTRDWRWPVACGAPQPVIFVGFRIIARVSEALLGRAILFPGFSGIFRDFPVFFRDSSVYFVIFRYSSGFFGKGSAQREPRPRAPPGI